MWGTQPDEMYRRRAERDGEFISILGNWTPTHGGIGHDMELHHCATTTGNPPEESDLTGATTSTAVSSPDETANTAVDGTWGERDVGGPVSHRMAMEEYEQMRRELTQLSQTRSRSTTQTRRGGILRTATGRTTKSRRTTGSRNQRSSSIVDYASSIEGEDLEAAEEFELGDFIRDGHFEKRTEGGESAKKVGVVFKHLTVRGVEASATLVRTLPDAIKGKIIKPDTSSPCYISDKPFRQLWTRSVSPSLRLRSCVEVQTPRADAGYST